MRIIKFRSWDFRNKIMDIPDHIANNIDGDKYQIMQYTGLKDKNSKEIYEGDILKWVYPAGYSLAEVKFGDFDNGEEYEDKKSGIGWYIVEYEHYNGEPTSEGQIENIKGYPLDTWEHEVIGNVYENPELLGKRKVWK